MSIFHDSIRELLEEVYSFLYLSLHQEVLSTAALARKEDLLGKLKTLQEQYPQLQLSLPVAEHHVGKRHSFTQQFSPSSPPPYVDMKGHMLSPASPLTADDDTNYASCDSDKSFDPENQTYTEYDDNQSYDGYKYTSVPANKVHYFEKYGILEKKGKERFGGLLTSSLKRWYAINQGLLYYYEKPTDQAQKGVVPLEGYEVRPVVMKDKKSGFCFEIVCPGKRTYQFSASTASDMKQWIAVIERNSKISYSAKGRPSFSSTTSEKKSSGLSEFSDTEEIYEELDDEEIENAKSQSHSPAMHYSNDHSNNLHNEKSNGGGNDPIMNYRELYVSLWDCSADEDNELNFFRGDIIRVLSKEYDSSAWWIGELNGKIGFVPKGYLMEAYEMC